jgi:hypothetical protein
VKGTMNQSHSVSAEVDSTLPKAAERRTKYERLELARALVIAQFGPAALIEHVSTIPATQSPYTAAAKR